MKPKIRLGNNTPGSLEMAVAARSDLETAQNQLMSIAAYVDELSGWVNATQTLSWAADQPPATVFSNSTSNSTQVALLSHSTVLSRSDCSEFQQSPININLARVLSPTTMTAALAEPLKFPKATSTQLVRARSLGDRVRIDAAQDGVGALGSVVIGGVARPFTYALLKAPGEHAVEGQFAPAELQLVHEPPHTQGSGAPVVVVAVRLYSGQAGDQNSWLAPLMQAMGGGNTVSSVAVGPIAGLHKDFDVGSTARYFRYDGTTTTVPCQAAQWFVLEEPGYISAQQLATVRAITPNSKPKKAFQSQLVTKGMQHLVDKVTSRGVAAALMHRRKASFLARGRKRPRLSRKIQV